MTKNFLVKTLLLMGFEMMIKLLKNLLILSYKSHLYCYSLKALNYETKLKKSCKFFSKCEQGDPYIQFVKPKNSLLVAVQKLIKTIMLQKACHADF